MPSIGWIVASCYTSYACTGGTLWDHRSTVPYTLHLVLGFCSEKGVIRPVQSKSTRKCKRRRMPRRCFQKLQPAIDHVLKAAFPIFSFHTPIAKAQSSLSPHLPHSHFASVVSCTYLSKPSPIPGADRSADLSLCSATSMSSKHCNGEAQKGALDLGLLACAFFWVLVTASTLTQKASYYAGRQTTCGR